MTRGEPIAVDDLSGRIQAQSNLTPGQFMIWTGHQLAPDLPVYNMGWCFGLDLEVDAGIFAQAFSDLASDCDTLRMVFDSIGEVPNFAVGSEPSGAHRMIRLSGAERDACVQELLKAPFDLSVETFRSALLHVDGQRWEWVLVQHHIATDAASGEILLRGLSDRYERLSQRRHESRPAPLPAFGDWAAGAGGQIDAKAAAFWAEKAGDMPAPSTPYAVEGATPSAQTVRVTVPLEGARMARLRALLDRDEFAALTPAQAQFNFLATALSGWLVRVSDAEGCVIGVTTHGRTTAEARQTAGLFMSTLPLGVQIAPAMTASELHAQVASTAMELMMHATAGVGTPGNQAPFNVVLNYIPTQFGRFAGAPVQVDWLEHGYFDRAHALWVDVFGFSAAPELSLSLRFNAGLFPASVRQGAVAQILRMIDAILADPDAVIETIALAGGDAQSALLTQGGGFADGDGPADILAAMERHCQKDPERPAICEGDDCLSRAALAARSDAVAGFLAGEGIGAGDRVGVYLTRGSDLVVAMLGVLKSGAAFVPLDPAQPAGRLAAIGAQAQLAVTLSEAGLADRWPGGGRVEMIAEIAQGGNAAPVVQSAPDADAYVIFTSGSTGTPKGVCIGRAALSRYADWAAQSYSAGGPATWALHSAIGFDLTITSIFAPLVSGGIIRAYRETLDGPDLSILRVFEEDRVDVVKLTPAHLALVLREGVQRRQIEALVLGGESLDTGLAKAAVEALGPHLAVFNEYGPTEATVGCMIHRFDPKHDRGRSVPIGRPARDTGIYILDQGLNPVPDMVTGEMYIAGADRLARGYLNQEDETALKFLANPFVPGTRMYRTGDLAHVDAQGVLHYHGRADDQIKIGSARVELGEIRNAVNSHPSVEASAVLYGSGRGDARPRRCSTCGLGTDHPDAEIDETGICRLCRDFETYRDKANAYFRSMEDLRAIIDEASAGGGASSRRYDCLMLLSGGKDSTYALGRLMELTPRVLAVTLDNGFIAQGAKDNIERVCQTLNVDHRFITTPHMNEIFADSLERHANVCNGCFKTIYTLGMQLAQKEGIGLIVTGLSRGQLFETRLAPELFGENAVSPDEIDRNILRARRSYHNVPDVAAQRLNGRFFDDGRVFEQIRYVDFYRYCDVTLDEIFTYLAEKVPWLRPTDTGRSSNCLINDLGIYIHKRRRGYHNYALPYSWDVRTGHKTREAALAELDDDLDEDRLHRQMRQIGYAEELHSGAGASGLRCYVVARAPVDAGDLRAHLATQLPRNMIPAVIIQVPEIPLTSNGKVDHRALDAIGAMAERADTGPIRAPKNTTEERLLEIWRNVLGREDFGTADNFFEIGGDSVHAISIASRASRAGLAVSALSVLTGQTVTAVAAEITTAREAVRPARAGRAALDQKSLDHLGALFGKRGDD